MTQLTLARYSSQLSSWLQTSIRNLKMEAESTSSSDAINALAAKVLEDYTNRVNSNYQQEVEPTVKNKRDFERAKNLSLDSAKKRVQVEIMTLLANKHKNDNKPVFLDPNSLA